MLRENHLNITKNLQKGIADYQIVKTVLNTDDGARTPSVIQAKISYGLIS